MQDRALEPDVPFMEVIQADAREVAKRTLRSKFGRLSNARILRIMHQAAANDRAVKRASDEELLALWFDAFEAAREELRKR